ncbi:hypothetical protein S83_038832 [Arachis hypogaea]
MGEENKVVGKGEKKKEESVGATAVVGDGEEEKNKKKKKGKKQGLISRIWNGIFRRCSGTGYSEDVAMISRRGCSIFPKRKLRLWPGSIGETGHGGELRARSS